MADFGKLLEPISPDQPAGVDLYYEKDFETIKEARRQEDAAPQGLWEREIKTADYKLVARLIESALTTKTKDLRLAAWLAEAWIYQEGSSGLVAGMQLLQSFLEKFWDSLYPLIDGDDMELRAGPLEWFGSYFDPTKGSSPKLAICRSPLVKGKFDFFVYQESRKVGYEAEVKDSEPRKKARLALIAEGKISAEKFDHDFDETPKAFYKKLAADYKQSLEELNKLDALCREKFTNSPPSFLALRKTIEEVANSVHILLTRKLKTDPDPVEASPATEEQTAADTAPSQVQSAAPTIDLSKLSGGPINSADQATLHVLASAQFLRRNSPASPLSYLLLRALRWGEVRELGEIKSTELFAPSGDIRMSLRAAAAANNWKLVLDIAETAMSNFTGRGWLDLQRYSVKACEELGYTAAAKALRSELKCFLADFPQLPKAILDDDTGAANPETLAWLEKEGLLTPVK
jgi:type VI secretion system protein ImpA